MKEGKMEYNARGCARLLAAVFLKDYTRKNRAEIRGDILESLRNGIKKERKNILNLDDIISLPESTKVLAEVIGKETALVLARECKNYYLYIPKEKMADDHFIVDTIGRELADKLQEVFGGELMPIAKCDYSYKEKRNEEIRKKLIEKKDVAAISKEYNISLSQIRRICYPRLAEKNRQLQRARRKKAYVIKEANEQTILGKLILSELNNNSNINNNRGGLMGPSEGGRERVGLKSLSIPRDRIF